MPPRLVTCFLTGLQSRAARLLVVATSAASIGCGTQNEFVPPPPPKVTVAQPLERPLADSIEFIGTTRATAMVDLRSRVNGYLEKIAFEDGATVAAGNMLFAIEKAPFQIALDTAKAALQKTEANLNLQRTLYARMLPLVRQGATTQEELDVQSSQVASAEADVATAEAAVRRAELDLNYSEIRAPIPGRIGRHLVDIGNLVQAEQTSLARIESINPIFVYFNVSERDLLRFMEMRRANQIPDPDKYQPVLHAALANETGFPHEGHLDFRELGIDPSTGTAMRRAVFPNDDQQLIPGLFVRLRAQVGEPVPRLMVEDRAVGTDQRGDFLLVVDDKNNVEYRPVRLGSRDGRLRVIQEGVGVSDWVIINGLQRARPGATVDPQRAEMQAEGDAAETAASPTADEAPAPPATEDEAAAVDPSKGDEPAASEEPSAPPAPPNNPAK